MAVDCSVHEKLRHATESTGKRGESEDHSISSARVAGEARCHTLDVVGNPAVGRAGLRAATSSSVASSPVR